MIYNFIPYSDNADKNIGKAYNDCMGLIADDDWALFVDHDAMFTIPDWYHRITEIVKENGEVGLFTAVANRIGNPEQRAFSNKSKESYNHNIAFHREKGRTRYRDFGNRIRDANSPISGIVLLLSKKTWSKTTGFKDGFLGVDSDMDRQIRKLGYKTCIMDGIYCYHWYRAGGSDLAPHGY